MLVSGCATPTPPPPPPTSVPHQATKVPSEATPVPPTAMAVSPTPAPADSSRLTHRIAFRFSNGMGEFQDRPTGEQLIPRGFDCVRLAPMSAANPGPWHSTLDPGFNELELTVADLQAMRDAAYCKESFTC
jgi:hypothetical protein